MAVGINYSFLTKGFSFAEDGRAIYTDGKDRNRRNFEKMLLTQAGDETQAQSDDGRYNPKYGLNIEKMLNTNTTLDEQVSNVRNEVQQAVNRFIENQKGLIAYLDESEIFVKGIVLAAPYTTGKIAFTIMLYTAEDIRLKNAPSFEKSFVG